MDSMDFLDGNYNPFAQTSGLSFAYQSGFFEYEHMDTLLTDMGLLSYVYGNEHIAEDPETCNPVDVMEPQVDFSEFLRGDVWFETVVQPTNLSEVLIAPDAPVPVQLMTPPEPVLRPPPPVPSTPKRPSVKATPGGVSNTGLFSPPPSDRPVRTRRHNAYDEICQLSNLTMNTPQSKKPVIESASIFATPLPPASRAPRTPVASVGREIQMRRSSPPSSCYSSSSNSSSDTFSPVDSPSTIMSDTFGGPLFPPEASVRRSTRRSGVDRPRLSRRGSCEKPYFRSYNNPTPSGERDRPHGCRHPGNIVPGDVPCFKNFARMHDWVRHQRVHNGQTPYECLSCGKAFKRSDARGRHWDGKSNCESYHMGAIREQLLLGQITIEHPDIPILRRRAQKTECRKESERTGVPMQELKAAMSQVEHEDIEGPGF